MKGKILARDSQRINYYKKNQEIVADYNHERDRVTIEETFARLVDLANGLDAEERRAAEEGLTEDELSMYDLLYKKKLSKANRERQKDSCRDLIKALQDLIDPLDQWTRKEQTQAEVKVFIVDHLC